MAKESSASGQAYDATVETEEQPSADKLRSSVEYYERELAKLEDTAGRLQEKRDKFQGHLDSIDEAESDLDDERDRLQADLEEAREQLERAQNPSVEEVELP